MKRHGMSMEVLRAPLDTTQFQRPCADGQLSLL